MRPARTRRLAPAVLAAALGTGIAVSVVLALPAKADATSACAPVPAPSPSPSATASPSPLPSGLCVSVVAAQSGINVGGTANWSVSAWAQGTGVLPGVWVTLTVDVSGLAATFTSCPSGTGGSSCDVGDVSSAGAQLQAQVQVPSSATNVTSVTMFAIASASTNPPMGSDPEVGQAVSVTSPSPSPSASSSASVSPSSSGHSSASPSSGVSSSKAPAKPPASGGVVPPAVGATSTLPGLFTLPPGPMPVIGTISSLSPSSIAGALPEVAPGPFISPASSPAANAQAYPGPGDSSSASSEANRFTLSIGMPAATALAIAFVVLALAILYSSSRLIRTRRAVATAGKASAGSAAGDQPTQLMRTSSGFAKWLRWPTSKKPVRRKPSGPLPQPPESDGIPG